MKEEITALETLAIGKVSPIKLYDPLIEGEFEIKVTEHYTIISISGRDYYFDVETGHFDGTSHDCQEPEDMEKEPEDTPSSFFFTTMDHGEFQLSSNTIEELYHIIQEAKDPKKLTHSVVVRSPIREMSFRIQILDSDKEEYSDVQQITYGAYADPPSEDVDESKNPFVT